MTNINVFISYAKEDKVSARRLQEDLHQKGIGTWLDMDDLIAGTRWKAAITEAIRKCTHFAAIFSLQSINKRGFVQAELKKALNVLQEIPEDKVYIIPVRLEPCEPSSPVIRELQWVDMFPDWSSGVDKFLQALAAPGIHLNQVSRFILKEIPKSIHYIGTKLINKDTVEFEYVGHMSPLLKQSLKEDVFSKFDLVLVYNPQAD